MGTRKLTACQLPTYLDELFWDTCADQSNVSRVMRSGCFKWAAQRQLDHSVGRGPEKCALPPTLCDSAQGLPESFRRFFTPVENSARPRYWPAIQWL